MRRRLKQELSNIFIRFLRQADVMHEGDRQFRLRHHHLPPLRNKPAPYPDISGNVDTEALGPAVFITGRFRSGSTLLWNLFRRLDDCTAYYEPLNERQWFNPALRGTRVDATHRGVNDYWREYEGMEDLAHVYREDWIREALYMDEGSYDPRLRQYIEQLIRRSTGTAVLQFNRVDFRLPWLKQHFPDVPIVHLYRHPREQWLSFLTNKQTMTSDTIEDSYVDGFYLNSWCDDLSRQYPMLARSETPHPYRRFYLLWKLSWLLGNKHSSVSVAYEELTQRPIETLSNLLQTCGWQTPSALHDVVGDVLHRTEMAWPEYAPEDWFGEHEAACECVLSTFLAPHPTMPS